MITSTANEKVKFLQSLSDKKVRQQEGCFLIEGVRLVEEALRSGALFHLVLYEPDMLARTDRGRVVLKELPAKVTFIASERAIRAAAETMNPQGIVAAVAMPEQPKTADGILTIILDGISDPGNLGTILRTADAAGIAAVITTKDSIDPFNPKTVRSAMGAHFHLRILADLDWTSIANLCHGRRIVVTGAVGGIPYYQRDWTEPAALVIGSEAHGASSEAKSLADETVTIPMTGRAESLNASVAAGVLMFEAQRQIMRKGIEEESRPAEPSRE